MHATRRRRRLKGDANDAQNESPTKSSNGRRRLRRKKKKSVPTPRIEIFTKVIVALLAGYALVSLVLRRVGGTRSERNAGGRGLRAKNVAVKPHPRTLRLEEAGFTGMKMVERAALLPADFAKTSSGSGDDEEDDDDDDGRPNFQRARPAGFAKKSSGSGDDDEGGDSDDGDNEPVYLSEKDYESNIRPQYTGSCEPMHDWQVSFYPSCNSFHAINMREASFISEGTARAALEVDGFGDEKIVIKILLYDTDLGEDFDYYQEQQRKDAMFMERASGSPYVADIYGFCGITTLVPFSSGGSLHDLIKLSRMNGGSKLATIDKLRIGYQLVTGVADLHSVDSSDTEWPSLAHNDICCHQYILFDGVYRLNDFNFAKIIRVDRKTKEQCLEDMDMAFYRGRGLEEFQYKRTRKRFKNDKQDVYMVGNPMYYVLTDKWLFEGYSGRAAIQKQLDGERSPFPSHIAHSKDPAEIALMKGIQMCWTHDPEERPTARAISDYLLSELKRITGESDPVIRVDIPRQDPDFRHTSSDYEEYMS